MLPSHPSHKRPNSYYVQCKGLGLLMLGLGWFHSWLPAGRNTSGGTGEAVRQHSKAKHWQLSCYPLIEFRRQKLTATRSPKVVWRMYLPALGLQSNLRILLFPDFLRKHCSESRRQNATVRIQILAMMYGAVRWAAACYPLPCCSNRQGDDAKSHCQPAGRS